MLREFNFERELEIAKERALECNEKKIPLEKQLNKLVGMENVKNQLRKWNDYVEFCKKSKKQGINICDNNFHMIFDGNPGTGKTMVAKVVANMLYSIGIIPTNKLVCVSAADTMKPKIGEGTDVIKKYIAQAYGGVLFIDEAYVWGDKTYLNSSGGNCANECIIPLLTAMEEYKDNLVIIFAGYHEAMKDFLKTNDGLESRIGCVIHFDDYNALELTKIYELKAREKGFIISKQAKLKINELMDYFSLIDNFGNGRFVEKVLTNTFIKKSQNKKDKDLGIIKQADVPSIKEMIEVGFNKHMLIPTEIDEESIKNICYHELGHALITYLFGIREIKYITTIPSGGDTLGGVCVEQKRRYIRFKSDIEKDIIELLAGRASEEVLIGNVSDGSMSDIANAKNAAEYMLTNYFFGFTNNVTYTVESILATCYNKAKEIISSNIDVITKVAKELLDKRTLTGEELIALFKENGISQLEYEY